MAEAWPKHGLTYDFFQPGTSNFIWGPCCDKKMVVVFVHGQLEDHDETTGLAIGTSGTPDLHAVPEHSCIQYADCVARLPKLPFLMPSGLGS